MARPNTRATFKEYCLRNLGKPVIDINVDEDQVEDRIDEVYNISLSIIQMVLKECI